MVVITVHTNTQGFRLSLTHLFSPSLGTWGGILWVLAGAIFSPLNVQWPYLSDGLDTRKRVCVGLVALLLMFGMSVSESVSVPSRERGWLNGQGLRASPLGEFHWRDMSKAGQMDGWEGGWSSYVFIQVTCTIGHEKKSYMGEAIIMDESSMHWCTK